MKAGGYLSIVAGLILLGLCVSQWSAGTGSTTMRALGDYNGGDRQDLAQLGRGGSLNDSARTAIEGIAGVFWLAVGGFLIYKDRAASRPASLPRETYRPRR